MRKAISGSPKNEKYSLAPSEGNRVDNKRQLSMMKTGSKAIKNDDAAGNNCSGFFAATTGRGNGFIDLAFLKKFPSNGPAIAATGNPMINPYKSVLPVLALNRDTSATGLGWGGSNPCVIESEAAMGIARYNKGKPVSAANEKIRGTSTTKPAL